MNESVSPRLERTVNDSLQKTLFFCLGLLLIPGGSLGQEGMSRRRSGRSAQADGVIESFLGEDNGGRPNFGQNGSIRPLRERSEKGAVPTALERRTLSVSQSEGEFFIHIPESMCGTPAPVVFVLHGGAASSGLAMNRKTDFTQLGTRKGYVTVYPSGVNGWNIGSHDMYSVRRRTSDADDVRFFRQMFDRLIEERIADPGRIYVVGGSNGGVMTMNLVCHLADRIAGAGVLVATLPRAAEMNWPKPSRPVPIVIMLGTQDPMKPWSGNRDQVSAEETVAICCKINVCHGQPHARELPDRDPHDGCRVDTQQWMGKAQVLFYRMDGHGHGWPMRRGRGKDGTGGSTRDISAPEELWNLFDGRNQPGTKM
jgi:polyhydroxybutyrate depolymerase